MQEFKTQNRIGLSIIIPEYNELRNLERGVLEHIVEYLGISNFDWELIISDDGSTDGSYEKSSFIAKRLNDPRISVLKNPHGGKAFAINHAIKTANKKWTLITDMDQSTPIEEIEKFLPFMDEYKIVIGSRGLKRRSSSVFRRIASVIFSGTRRLFVPSEINDTQCGFKLFDTVLLKNIFPKLDALSVNQQIGWTVTAFDVELIYMLEYLDYDIAEVRIHWTNTDESDTKNRDKKFIAESIDMLRQLAKITWRRMTGYYKNLLK